MAARAVARAVAERTREAQRQAEAMTEAIRVAAQRDLADALGPVEARAAAAEAATTRLSAAAAHIERQTNARLAEQARQIAGLRVETAERFDAAQREFRAALRAERDGREQAMESLRAEIRSARAGRGLALEDAGRWLDDAGVLVELIGATLPHERFTPGRLAALGRNLGRARENVEAGFAEAALAAAQGVYQQLSDLRVEVEYLDRQWRTLRAGALDALGIVVDLLERGAVQPVLDEDGDPLPGVTLDVDRWSRGELTALRAEVTTLLADVRADEPGPAGLAGLAGPGSSAGPAGGARRLDPADLREVVETRAPAYEARLAAVIEAAGTAQLGSQLRVSIADAVVGTLVGDGFVLADHTYAGQDDRNGFYARVEHPDGGIVVVDVSPAEDDPGACELRVLSYDDVGAEDIRADRARALAGVLRAQGLEVTDPAPGPMPAEVALRDLDRVRRGPIPREAPAAGGGHGHHHQQHHLHHHHHHQHQHQHHHQHHQH
ncbi:conserved hypothetical protein; putative coiled-coil domain [Frankia alni ACN14a]|uniref:Uncharacterized protein n=1 Tax=Frankia alni (strain DSM 45986 / CECT 9034 / ACN14a) TaxID=326424 RepID=Q0RU45_FRAAA|nr:conserved hypothetical protein; putative coiled-coil domain [Frankia alni ACN14a]